MLRLDHISKVYPTGEVLKDINWEVKAEEKVGLVGVNGAGKSTQLKIITGAIEPTSGNIVRPASLHLGYLDQEFDVEPTYTVREELWTVFDEAGEAQRALHLLHQEMEQASLDELDGLITKLDRLQRRFESLDGYNLETKIDKILPEMGFEPQDGDRLVSSFSGGWQMRICLAKILLKKPDILLLDEPTNHLDLATIEWLEKYLKTLKIPMVIISHDREFLDRICSKIVETERGVSTTYLGNYSNYLLQKDTVKEAQEKAYEMQQKELEKQQAFIDRFRASATRSTQAKSREKQLDKIERIESPLTNLKSFHFKFPPSPRSGLEVVTIKNLSHTFNNNILFLGANLLIERGDKIAILGPNGAGKSTLLKMITGLEKPEEGEVSLGKHNVIAGYFAQNQAEALPLEKLVIDTIHDEVPDWKNEEVRTLLGRFLFTGETVFKAVGALSGGEKARLALAKMLLRPCNLLMLDEPTNHLDIPAKEMLEEAIQHYDGTAIIISHDRYFISRIANKIVEIRNGELIVYHGDYHYYLDKLEAEKAQLQQATKKSRKQAKSKK